MPLLVDTDAFCKLGTAGLLHDAIALFGVDVLGCRRLPALPHMLRRGRLRKIFGASACDALIPLAETIPILSSPSDRWLDQLAHRPAIDPGDALILAAAAETESPVLTGDKRALRAVKDAPGFPEALSERVAVLDAVLLALCDRQGVEAIRRCVAPIAASDMMLQVCFSPGNLDPADTLLTYYQALAAELAPLVLWNPRPGGGA